MRFLFAVTAAGLAYMLGSGQSRRLERRLAELERRLGDGAPAVKAPSAPKPAPQQEPVEEITPEVIAVISAAVAAFVGKKARIKQVRRVRSTGINPWTQQGRVYIQGSHNLAGR